MSLISYKVLNAFRKIVRFTVVNFASADSTLVQNGFTHAFVFEFENEDDRNFYVKQDEAHLAFVATLEGFINGVQVLDYTPGNY